MSLGGVSLESKWIFVLNTSVGEQYCESSEAVFHFKHSVAIT